MAEKLLLQLLLKVIQDEESRNKLIIAILAIIIFGSTLISSMIPIMFLGTSVTVISEHSYFYPLEHHRYISSGYSEERLDPVTGDFSEAHLALDFPADIGTPILASRGGYVMEVGETEVSGLYVKIQHSDGSVTYYGHCSEILVERSQTVGSQEVIALVGNTGWSTGPHVHFEIRLLGGVHVNPEEYLIEMY